MGHRPIPTVAATAARSRPRDGWTLAPGGQSMGTTSWHLLFTRLGGPAEHHGIG